MDLSFCASRADFADTWGEGFLDAGLDIDDDGGGQGDGPSFSSTRSPSRTILVSYTLTGIINIYVE